MRRLFIGLIVVAVLVAGAIVVGDVVTVHLTESAIAKRIEQRVPGSHATVTISSQPFLVQLASSGTVEELHAHVTGVVEDNYSFDSIDVRVDNLQVNRNDLLTGSVHLDKISKAVITATMSRDDLVKAGLLAGLRQLGVLGPTSRATVNVGASSVVIDVDGTKITVPYTTLIPCIGSATVSNGNLVLTCTTDKLPPALADQST